MTSQCQHHDESDSLGRGTGMEHGRCNARAATTSASRTGCRKTSSTRGANDIMIQRYAVFLSRLWSLMSA